jgi:hopanoid biosynthesis associated protein HpnK
MSAGTRLIVHGDDFGLSEAVNRGILASHRDGILTSASIMATGSAFEHAVDLAKSCPSLDVGVHLTLTEQRPLAPRESVATLVDADGRFAPHAFAFARRYLRGQVARGHLRNEFDAQIRRVRDAGIPVSHLDGHQHVHMLPEVARVVADLARAHGIRAVRHPAERLRGYMLKEPSGARRVAEKLLVSLLCSVSPLRSLKRTDDFVGFYFGGRLNEQNLLTVLGELAPHGIVELMCHPGEDDPASPYRHWGYAWAAELEALVSSRVKRAVQERDVILVSYRDV